MSVDASRENAGVGTASGFECAGVVLADLVLEALIIVVPDLVARVVEAHLAGRNLHYHVSVVSHSLVHTWEQVHEIVSEDIVANAG